MSDTPRLDSAPDGPQAAPDADAVELSGVSHPERALAPVSLEELPPPMQAACGRAGWRKLMPVQSLALPYLMDGRDIMIQSRTGSGKTGCYLLPLVPALRPDAPGPQALVLVPTRELALQVTEEARVLLEGTGIRAATLYGGVGYGRQLEQLKEGAHLVVGTPGRILDHLLRRSMTLDALRVLVFDEADRMLSIGFYPDMKEIQRWLPDRRLYTSLFSATYPEYVLSLAAEFMTEPAMLSLSHKQVYVPQVDHCFCPVKPLDKDRALVRLIETENPSSAFIFCNTRANVHYVASVLQGFGYNAGELSADLPQNRREEVMQQVRAGRIRFLVATDLAGRGIDIPNLSHVFLYELPEDQESYIHRSGRTGRAGTAGTVIALTDVMERLELERIAKRYDLQFREIPAPTDGDVAEVVANRLQTLLETRFRSLTGLEKVRIQRYAALAKELASLPADDENDGTGLNLLAMLLDACHHNTLNDLRLPQPPSGDAPKQGRRSRRREKGSRDEAGREGRRGKEAGSASGAGEAATAAPDAAGPEEAPAPDAAGSENAEKPKKRRRRRRRRGGGSQAEGQPEGQSEGQPEGQAEAQAETRAETPAGDSREEGDGKAPESPAAEAPAPDGNAG